MERPSWPGWGRGPGSVPLSAQEQSARLPGRTCAGCLRQALSCWRLTEAARRRAFCRIPCKSGSICGQPAIPRSNPSVRADCKALGAVLRACGTAPRSDGRPLRRHARSVTTERRRLRRDTDASEVEQQHDGLEAAPRDALDLPPCSPPIESGAGQASRATTLTGGHHDSHDPRRNRWRCSCQSRDASDLGEATAAVVGRVPAIRAARARPGTPSG